MDIRRATATDLPALTALAARTFPLACPPTMALRDIEDFIAANLNQGKLSEHLANDRHHVFVADDGVGLTGWALLLVEGEEAFLSKCYTDPAVHGSGVAQDLAAAATAAAAEAGARCVRLGVNQNNERAIRFYRKIGFETVGERQFTVGTRVEDDFVMELVLQG